MVLRASVQLIVGVAIAVIFVITVATAEATSKNAYATIHYEGTPKDAEYLLAIRVMMRSLRRTGTKADMVILVSPNVKEETRQILRQDGAIIAEVPNLQNPYKGEDQQKQRYLARFEFTLNKLYMWNLTQYERVVYLDADNIALGNLDELFDCGHFCAVFMNPCNFHTGLLVIKPDTRQFNHMVKALYNRTVGSYDGADQGFLTAYFPFKEMGGAPMFDPDHPQKDAPLLRLPPGYNLNALWFYEHGSWHLYRCHERFCNMSLPGLAMTFPVAPFIKPWNWWPYLILDDNWNIWQGIRAELGESHAHVMVLAIVLLAGFAGLVLWLAANLLQSPCLSNPSYRTKALKGLDNFIGWVYGGNTTVGYLLGVSCVLLSALIPFLMLPATLPPKMAYAIFVITEFTLNFVFAVFATSYLRSDTIKRPLMSVLLRKTLVGFLPSVVLAFVDGAIVTFQWYPRSMFHLGKIILVAHVTFLLLILQVRVYQRLLVQARPIVVPPRIRPVEDPRLPM